MLEIGRRKPICWRLRVSDSAVSYRCILGMRVLRDYYCGTTARGGFLSLVLPRWRSRRTERQQLTRLETRTKESNMCASRWVANPRGASNLTEQNRPTMIFCDRFECEHACWDPKDGELCLSRAKPEETLVEARSDTDVQIVRQTWV